MRQPTHNENSKTTDQVIATENLGNVQYNGKISAKIAVCALRYCIGIISAEK
jgi:hypothetical protein